MGKLSNKTTKEAFITWIAWICDILGGIAAGFGLLSLPTSFAEQRKLGL